jgi:hypothetical protein
MVWVESFLKTITLYIEILPSKKETQSIAKAVRKHRTELTTVYRVRRSAVGYKIKNARLTDEIGIIIFVTKKQDESKLRSLNVEPVPKSIDGIATDVQAISIFPRAPDDSRYTPIQGGIATIRHPSPYVGTLGLVIRKGKKLFGITNNHVGANEDILGLRPSAARRGDPWVQPSIGSVSADRIGKLYRWNRLKTQGPGKINYYDLAIGELVEPGLSRGIKANEIKDIGQVAGAEEIHLDDIVMKRGRTTRKRTGRVIATDARFYVQYRGFNCDFEDQVAIIGHPNPVKPFSLQGDSGSVVVSAERDPNTNAHKLKALLFAGGENDETGFDETFASPVKRILRDFNLKF